MGVGRRGPDKPGWGKALERCLQGRPVGDSQGLGTALVDAWELWSSERHNGFGVLLVLMVDAAAVCCPLPATPAGTRRSRQRSSTPCSGCRAATWPCLSHAPHPTAQRPLLRSRSQRLGRAACVWQVMTWQAWAMPLPAAGLRLLAAAAMGAWFPLPLGRAGCSPVPRAWRATLVQRRQQRCWQSPSKATRTSDWYRLSFSCR